MSRLATRLLDFFLGLRCSVAYSVLMGAGLVELARREFILAGCCFAAAIVVVVVAEEWWARRAPPMRDLGGRQR